MKFLSVLGAILVIIGHSGSGLAHGTRGYVEKIEGFRIVAEYDDGEPMSYGDVTIKPPNADMPFQTGRTDRNGHFLFQPDKQGQWHIEVKDGMGHRLALGLVVGADGTAPETVNAHSSMASERMTRPLQIVAGLCIIFGMSGFFYGWKARRTVASAVVKKVTSEL
jgi:nickel transport protein